MLVAQVLQEPRAVKVTLVLWGLEVILALKVYKVYKVNMAILAPRVRLVLKVVKEKWVILAYKVYRV
jgi:hypothetical protein